MTQTRLDQLTQILRAEGIDYVALVPGANMIYFTGLHMHLSERPIVALFSAKGDAPILVAPFFEMGKATSGPVKLDWRTYSYRDGEDPQTVFQRALDENDIDGQVIGVEPTQMRVLEWNLLQNAAGEIKQTSAAEAIKQLRMVKDAQEVAEMRRAIEIAQQGLTDTLPHIKAGMKESDVAALLVDHMTKRGSQGVAFEPLIQTGLSATNPHGHAGERVLQMGDLIVIDWGCRYGNYQSDITRTLAIGLISVELRTLYETVKAANAAGRAAIKPGVTCEAVDRAARGVIEAAGYGEWFTHRTGHGLGLEGHEPPYMVAGETMSLRPGMTFTIEPGLYVPGVGGVRIEDDVIVTETGGESLTNFERELITVDSINQ